MKIENGQMLEENEPGRWNKLATIPFLVFAVNNDLTVSCKTTKKVLWLSAQHKGKNGDRQKKTKKELSRQSINTYPQEHGSVKNTKWSTVIFQSSRG